MGITEKSIAENQLQKKSGRSRKTRKMNNDLKTKLGIAETIGMKGGLSRKTKNILKLFKITKQSYINT